MSNRENGAKGGRATAAKHDADWREQRSRHAGLACAARYGSDFYKRIRDLRAQLRGIAEWKRRKRTQKLRELLWQQGDPGIQRLVEVTQSPAERFRQKILVASNVAMEGSASQK